MQKIETSTKFWTFHDIYRQYCNEWFWRSDPARKAHFTWSIEFVESWRQRRSTLDVIDVTYSGEFIAQLISEKKWKSNFFFSLNGQLSTFLVVKKTVLFVRSLPSKKKTSTRKNKQVRYQSKQASKQMNLRCKFYWPNLNGFFAAKIMLWLNFNVQY